MNESKTWLNLRKEEAIDPALPICDPHHHFWDRRQQPGVYENYYLLDELLQDMGGGHNIVSTVFIECRAMYKKNGPKELQPVGETEFVQGMAAQSASGLYGPTAVAAGIVGFADLTLGKNVAPVLEAQLAASPTRFRGIRNSTGWHENPRIHKSPINSPQYQLSDPKFREGFACLQNYNLSFDAWLYHTQLKELADLAHTFPDIPVIINHVGGPLGIGPYAGKRAEVFEDWKHSIELLADCPNVVMKLGGLSMPICGFGWHKQSIPPSSSELAEAMAPYYLFCIEQFGVNRCMFESNFPVDKISCSYTVLWNAFKRITQDFSPEDRSRLFHDTAVKTYRI